MSDSVKESAKIVAVTGASLMKVKRATSDSKRPKAEQAKRTKRGKVTKFSRASRRHLFHLMASVKKVELPCFVTLTYPEEYSFDYSRWKRDLHVFLLRLGYHFPECSGIWKLEPQKRGAPHYHLLVWKANFQELVSKVPMAWYEIVGSNDPKHLLWHQGLLGNHNEPCVKEVTSTGFLFKYAAKYVGKSTEEIWSEGVGRWWGVFYKERLPVGETEIIEVPDKLAVDYIRYLRRFAHVPARAYKSLQVICDADHWLEKIQTVPMNSYRDWLETHKFE